MPLRLHSLAHSSVPDLCSDVSTQVFLEGGSRPLVVISLVSDSITHAPAKLTSSLPSSLSSLSASKYGVLAVSLPWRILTSASLRTAASLSFSFHLLSEASGSAHLLGLRGLVRINQPFDSRYRYMSPGAVDVVVAANACQLFVVKLKGNASTQK